MATPKSSSSPPSSSPIAGWILYALLSGLCAAANGVFAKLVTTTLTSAWAGIVTEFLLTIIPKFSNDGLFVGSLTPERIALAVEGAVRGAFLLLNISFNGLMWALFTRALTLATSSVQVSVINTSANFMATALLGMVVFGERLPPLWWVGAAMLIAGSVIIGRREGEDAKRKADGERERVGGGDTESVASGTNIREKESKEELRRRAN